MSALLRASAAALLLCLAACTAKPPPCPFHGPGDRAPSAGCLSLVHGQMLVVEGWDGRVSPPGGHTRVDESAQCAAHREAWEEAGLDLEVGGLVHTFETGFNLYRCDIHPGSGAIDPHAFTEVKRAYWLPVADFERVEWRFPRQGRELMRLIQSSEPGAASH